ncbi:MAG: OFA family MFS transporter [Leptolyngbyaceae cyanobacterium]
MDIAKHKPELTVLGLPAERGRWLFIPLGMVVLLCAGSVYSWSIFRKSLELDLNISAASSLLPYTVVLVFYSVFVLVGGAYIPRLGVRLVAAIGGICIGCGYILSSIAGHIGILTLTYGVIAGTGVGTVYGVPMVVVARWFPDKKGFAVGATIVGFGLSPLITAPLANYLINTYTVRPTLRLLGIVFMVIILGISALLKLPPQGWQPRQYRADADTTDSRTYPSKLTKSRAFYGLWLCYSIGTLIGLSAIGISSPVGEEIIQIRPELAASSVALFALFNGLSRPLFGWLCDRIKPHYVATGSYVLSLIACLLMLGAQQGQVITYLVSFCILWFCLGGWLAMAPTITLRFFNPSQYAQNYGVVFTAYGVGALIGTLATGQIRDWLGTYLYVLYPLAFLAIVGILVANSMLKRDPGEKP